VNGLHAERLSREDAAILELERGPIAGHTVKVVVLEGTPLTLDGLRERIAERLQLAPRCRQRLEPGARGLPPAWVEDEDFDLAAHVWQGRDEGATGEEGLRALVAEAIASRLDRSRPLWSLRLVAPLAEGGSALVIRLHHAWADGATAVHVLTDLLWDEAEVVHEGTAAVGPVASSPSSWEVARREVERLPGSIVRELLPRGGRSPFTGAVGRRREVAFVPGRLSDYRAVAHGAGGGATVNDVLLAVIAGGLCSWIGGGAPPALSVKVPVSLHPRNAAEAAGNRDSFMVVELPLAEPDPLARLRAIAGQTATRKHHHDPETIDRLLSDLATIGPVERLLRRLLSSSREFALSASNVPGPRDPVHVLGAPVRELYTVAEVGLDHALRASAISLCDSFAIGLCADPAIVPGLPSLARGMADALGELRSTRDG
jgi:WS/DGAT/MGAT family acyltransferase